MTEPPLPYNPEHIGSLCECLGLGVPLHTLSRVYGGFHHQMWRLDTALGAYAIKQLCADTDVHNPFTVRHYNATESIAQGFSWRGIPAVSSLASGGRHLQVFDNTGYLVYPWTEATALEIDAVTDEQAMQVAQLMARMHLVNLDLPECPDAQYDIHPDDMLVELVSLAEEKQLATSTTLVELQGSFLQLLQDYQAAIPTLQQVTVISHGDLDHKNVLWDNDGRPLIIDWESARKLNPTYEIVLEALEWSGITSDFKADRFHRMLGAYAGAGGKVEVAFLEPAFHVVLGDWLNWLLYNLGRNIYLEDGDPGALGAEQVGLALATIQRAQYLMPDLLSVSVERCLGSASLV